MKISNHPIVLILVFLFCFFVYKFSPLIIKKIRLDADNEISFLSESRLNNKFMYAEDGKSIPFYFILFYFVLFYLCIQKDFLYFIPLSLLCVMSYLDVKINIVPDFISYCFIWSGVIFNSYFFPDFFNFKCIYPLVSGYLFFYFLNKLKFGVYLAGGDLKVIAGVGSWFGFFIIPYLIVLLLILSFFNLFSRKISFFVYPGIPMINFLVFIYLLRT